MCSSAKLLLVALCGAVLASSALSVDASSVGVAAYRGGAVGSVAGAMQQQQAPAAAGQAAAAQMQAAVKASTAAYRDSKYQVLATRAVVVLVVFLCRFPLCVCACIFTKGGMHARTSQTS
jgi:hypothetical protein